MSTESELRTQSRRWRSILLLLVVLPFVPEMVTLATTVYAHLAGCEVADKTACAMGNIDLSEIIRAALKAGTAVGVVFAYGFGAIWLGLCYWAIVRGWHHRSSRLATALAVSVLFAFLPYLAPALSIGHLVNPKCIPNEGGIPPECIIYGGDIGDAAPAIVLLVWKSGFGAPVALAAFIVFVLATRRKPPDHGSSRQAEGPGA